MMSEHKEQDDIRALVSAIEQQAQDGNQGRTSLLGELFGWVKNEIGSSAVDSAAGGLLRHARGIAPSDTEAMESPVVRLLRENLEGQE